MKIPPFVLLLAGMALALLVSLPLVYFTVNPTLEELRALLLVMLGTGTGTLSLAYFIYHQSVIRWFATLRGVLLTSMIVTILLVMSNIGVTAQLMFISNHDFLLTTSLLIFAGITAASFGLFITSMISQRLHDLSAAADALAQGKFETRLHVQGRDEVAEFAHRFNWMAERLQQIDHEKRLVEQTRRDLIAGVSHDLRTPITAIRAMLEALQDKIVTDPETVNRYLQNSLNEIGSLSHLIDDLFELSRLDTGHSQLDFVTTSLTDLISDVVSNLAANAHSRGLTLHSDINPSIDPVRIAPDKIQRVLYNLMDNALRYTPAGEHIYIRAYQRDGQACVEVQNTGALIPEEHLPHIFHSFYRVEAARLRAEDGHRSSGLGLAIARGLIEAHRGTIQVESRPEIGTRFTFSIPRT